MTSIKSDSWIKRMALHHKMITPFVENQTDKTVISYGVSSYGYDMRLADEFKVFCKNKNSVSDPKIVNPNSFKEYKGSVCVIPPNSFILGRSYEYFRIPRKVLSVCFGKSTYARNGVLVNVTPLEPEWEGYVTISISNTSPVPVKVYAFEGIAQVLFLESDSSCAVSYADKKGRYQAQKKITVSKTEKKRL